MLMGASASMAQNKMWAKFDNGILTFTYGAKPRIVQSPVKCSECGKMLAAADKYCSNCGTAKPASMTDVFEVPQNIENNVIPWQVDSKEVKKVVFTISCKRYSTLTCTRDWFKDMSNLTSIEGLENLNTSNVKDMSYMFTRCNNLTSLNLSQFNTSNVNNMKYMFNSCENLTSLDLSHFNTSKVTDMSGMFGHCENLTSLDLSRFNTNNVTVMNGMFSNCLKLTSLDLSHFNTSKVTDMSDMLGFCENLTFLDLSRFNTSKVTDMGGMFYGCKNLKSLDISHFDMNIIKNVHAMFCNCTSLKKLYLPASSWDLDKFKERYKKANNSYSNKYAVDIVFKNCYAEIVMR